MSPQRKQPDEPTSPPARERSGPEHNPGQGVSTRAVHDGERRRNPGDALTTPLFQTSTYVFADTDEILEYNAGIRERFEYGRYGNPTQRAAELKIAALERQEDALLFPSGMNAIGSALLALLRAGDHAVLVEDCYRNVRRFCENVLVKFGVELSLVRACDHGALEAAFRPETRVLIAESPTNPHLRVPDLEQLVASCSQRGVQLLLDSTLATPYNQRGADFGADLVAHSVTKYLNGHQDLMAGALAGSREKVEAIRGFCRPVGGVPDPHQSWLILRGLKTFALRMERHNQNALAIARYLDHHAKVQRVWYPGLDSHPDFQVAKAQLRGFGGVVSFELEGDQKRTLALADAFRLFLLGPSLGGVESLASHPATVSYSDWTPGERDRLGIADNLIRLAVGIEDPEDLIADLDQALASV